MSAINQIRVQYRRRRLSGPRNTKRHGKSGRALGNSQTAKSDRWHFRESYWFAISSDNQRESPMWGRQTNISGNKSVEPLSEVLIIGGKPILGRKSPKADDRTKQWDINDMGMRLASTITPNETTIAGKSKKHNAITTGMVPNMPIYRLPSVDKTFSHFVCCSPGDLPVVDANDMQVDDKWSPLQWRIIMKNCIMYCIVGGIIM